MDRASGKILRKPLNVQDGIDVQGEIFLKINEHAEWKFTGKSIIMQVILIFETEIFSENQ